jgi:hypothetical protein
MNEKGSKFAIGERVKDEALGMVGIVRARRGGPKEGLEYAVSSSRESDDWRWVNEKNLVKVEIAAIKPGKTGEAGKEKGGQHG